MAKGSIVLICLAALLTGCSAETRAYRSPFDRFVATLDLERTLNYYPCTYTYIDYAYSDDGTQVITSIPPDRCYHFDPPRRMRGVWLTDTEASTFLPDATKAPDTWRFAHDKIWLQVESEIYQRVPDSIRPEEGPGAYAIDFVGRRTTYPCDCGGMGGSPHMVILDKLVSVTAIPPPKRMTREEIRRELLAMPPHLPKPPRRWRKAIWFACPGFICLPPSHDGPETVPGLSEPDPS